MRGRGGNFATVLVRSLGRAGWPSRGALDRGPDVGDGAHRWGLLNKMVDGADLGAETRGVRRQADGIGSDDAAPLQGMMTKG